MLTRFRCGCVGRENSSPRSKVKEFIKVAELRGASVEESEKDCPSCKAR